MNSPYSLVIACRSALVIFISCVLLVCCWVLPQSVFAELASSGVVGFVLLLLIQLAFPWHRKSELIPVILAAAFFLGGARAALQGAPWLTMDAFALGAGVGLGNLALAVERMRATARR